MNKNMVTIWSRKHIGLVKWCFLNYDRLKILAWHIFHASMNCSQFYLIFSFAHIFSLCFIYEKKIRISQK